MSISPQSSGAGWRCHLRRLAAWGLPPLLAALLVLGSLVAPGAAAGEVPQRWTLSDAGGHRWSLSLFRQPDPAYPSGWRLRLAAGSPGLPPDHHLPLVLEDSLGGRWELPNRSEELVPPGGGPLPAEAAQFDGEALRPRPSDVLPLRGAIPLAAPAGEVPTTANLVLTPDAVAALHGLPPESLLAMGPPASAFPGEPP